MFLLQYKQITEQMHNCVIDCLRGERDDVVTNFNITMINIIIIGNLIIIYTSTSFHHHHHQGDQLQHHHDQERPLLSHRGELAQ